MRSQSAWLMLGTSGFNGLWGSGLLRVMLKVEEIWYHLLEEYVAARPS